MKKLLLGVLGLLLLVAVFGMLLPRHVKLERATTIARPASLVYATVNSFQRFAEWSPWADYDPAMKQNIEGPRSGVGAKLSWSGNKKVGTGSQIITAVVANESVASDLDFGDLGRSQAEFKLQPDRMVGPDYERGLAHLKKLVEALPDTDIAGLDVQTVDLQAQPIVTVSVTTAADTPSISKGYAAGYARLGKFIARHKLQQRGAPLGIDRGMSATQFSFDAALPVDRADVAAEGDVRVQTSYAGKALKITHVGAYESLGDSYQRMSAYLAAHGYQSNGTTISRYIDDPTVTPVDSVRTELYWPIK